MVLSPTSIAWGKPGFMRGGGEQQVDTDSLMAQLVIFSLPQTHS